jgi:hypothetical protein
VSSHLWLSLQRGTVTRVFDAPCVRPPCLLLSIPSWSRAWNIASSHILSVSSGSVGDWWGSLGSTDRATGLEGIAPTQERWNFRCLALHGVSTPAPAPYPGVCRCLPSPSSGSTAHSRSISLHWYCLSVSGCTLSGLTHSRFCSSPSSLVLPFPRPSWCLYYIRFSSWRVPLHSVHPSLSSAPGSTSHSLSAPLHRRCVSVFRCAPSGLTHWSFCSAPTASRSLHPLVPFLAIPLEVQSSK